jgi:PAS domain S-box-containing protein
MLVAGAGEVFAARPHRVLLLHSYHRGFNWTDSVELGVRETLQARGAGAELLVEYMDAKRHSGASLGPALAGLLRRKYATWQPDVILTCDDDALQFMFAHGERLFPGVPVVFCGLNLEDYDPALLQGRPGYTGVVERLDLASTVDLILMLQPEMDGIVFVHDRTTSGLADRRTVESLAPRYAGRAGFVFPDQGGGLSRRELLSRLGALKPNQAVYFLGFFRDRLGEPLAAEHIIPLISAASPVPVYTHAEAYLGHGVLGGKLLSGQVHGRAAAGLATEILGGADPDRLPVRVESSNRYLFDYRQLARFGLPESALPADSLVRFQPSSFWERHRRLVTWSLAGLAALLAITALLSVATLRLRAARRRLLASERALSARNSQMERLLEASPAIFYSFSTSSGGMLHSAHVQRMLGYSPEELRAQPYLWHDSIHPDDVERVDGAIAQAADGQEFEVEYRIRDRQGRWHWLWDGGAPLPDDSGDMMIQGVALDITERKEAETERERRELIFAQAERLAELGSWEWDLESGVIMVSDNWLRIHGCDQSRLTFDELKTLAHPEDLPAIQEAFRRAVDLGEPYDSEHRIIRQDNGEVRHVQAYGAVERDATGAPRRMYGAGQDVTERRRAERRLAASEKDLRLAQSISGVGNWSLDPAVGVPEWSEQVYRIYERDPRLGPYSLEDYRQVYRGEWWERFDTAIRRAISQGEPYDMELKLELGPGRVKWVQAICQPDLPPGPVGHLLRGTIQDITERMEAERRISAALEEKQVLLREINHRVKNNMQVISSLLRLQATAAGSPAARQALADSLGRVTAMARVHESLYEAGSQPRLELGGFLGRIAADAAAAYRPAPHRQVEVEVGAEGVTAERDQAVSLGLAVNELVTNSLKYAFAGPGQGSVMVSARRLEDGGLELTVADDGRGLPSGWNLEAGSGMGLGVVRDLVERQLGGSIELLPGPGAVFRLCIPRHQAGGE